MNTPMNTAHQHAANADEYAESGLIVLAADEHLKAADAYMAAVERSQDEAAKRTLRKLFDEHCKAAKELERRIEKLKSEGKDPALPQKFDYRKTTISASTRQNSTAPTDASRISSSSPLQLQRTMADTVDESFMLLGGQRSDPGDAFNHFWNIMQGMLDNLSQPVAFATIPLNNYTDDADYATDTKLGEVTSRLGTDSYLASDKDVDEPILARFTRHFGIGREKRIRTSEEANIVDRSDADSFVDGFFDEGDELSESFLLISSEPEPSSTTLKRENTVLKSELAVMQKRLEATERVLQLRKEQDLQLRDSIFQATREAQRVMGASGLLHRPSELSAPSINTTGNQLSGLSSGREAQYLRRIKELEDELRTIKTENEKNKAMILKFRERWEKLKESAKRKKELKTVNVNMREHMAEEPEVKEASDEQVG
ncbi:hypothetical protein BDQ17DRAFT_1315583 [Cyathus striatus]|nr:hypothetical protein BDQ17DRAFT_1315583 [Cyathus striatus]